MAVCIPWCCVPGCRHGIAVWRGRVLAECGVQNSEVILKLLEWFWEKIGISPDRIQCSKDSHTHAYASSLNMHVMSDVNISKCASSCTQI